MRKELRKVNFPAGTDGAEQTFEREGIEAHGVREMTIWEAYAGQMSYPNGRAEEKIQPRNGRNVTSMQF